MITATDPLIIARVSVRAAGNIEVVAAVAGQRIRRSGHDAGTVAGQKSRRRGDDAGTVAGQNIRHGAHAATAAATFREPVAGAGLRESVAGVRGNFETVAGQQIRRSDRGIPLARRQRRPRATEPKR